MTLTNQDSEQYSLTCGAAAVILAAYNKQIIALCRAHIEKKIGRMVCMLARFSALSD